MLIDFVITWETRERLSTRMFKKYAADYFLVVALAKHRKVANAKILALAYAYDSTCTAG